MSKVTLISEGSKYSSLLLPRLKRNGGSAVILTDNADKNEEAENDKNGRIVWNKRSPLSARNAILSAVNAYDEIENAILVYRPGGFNKTFHETSSAVYDLQVDRWVKGYGYLIKELIQLFIKQQKGTVSLILDTGGIKMLAPLENAIFSYLKSLVKSLSVLYQNEEFRIFCFEADTDRREDFIDFFLKVNDDTRYSPGKIHRFGDRKSLFDFGRN